MSNKNGILGERLRMARVASGFKSRAAAAEAAGVPPDTLKLYEAGNTMPGADKLYSLALLYNREVGWLLGRSDHRDSLPTGKVIVDQVLVDKIINTTEESALASYLQDEPSPVLCMLEIPEDSRLTDLSEAFEINQRVLTHLMEHAPFAVRRWSRKFGGLKKPTHKTKKNKGGS